MATYKQIQEDVKSSHGVSVKTCHIAHVKHAHNLTTRTAPNRIDSYSRVYPCPDTFKVLIEESMRKFGMIP